MQKNNRNWIFSLMIMGLSLLLINGCKKSEDDTTSTASGLVVTTTAVSNIGTKTATSGGNISNAAGMDVVGRGVCWSTAQNPTVASKSTFDPGGVGSFTSSMTGLASNTTYYVKAYAGVGSDIIYGNQVSFKTTVPGVNSLSATVDGVSYVATSFNVLTASGKIGISGMNGMKNLLLWLPDPFTTGSHSLATFGDYMGQYAPDASDIWTSTSGTINISEYVASTGKIKGTFNFVGSNNSTTVNVTSGQFEVYK